MRKGKFPKKIMAILISVMMILMFSGQVLLAEANNNPNSNPNPNPGAIWTTDGVGEKVNGNLYDLKTDVYLNGGPNGGGNAGLPDGDYYIKVTTPEGALLGSSLDTVQPTVEVNGGLLPQKNLWNILKKASNGETGYDTTTNSGGEYKVWASMDSGFPNSSGKTDNFKVKAEPVPAISLGKTADKSLAGLGDKITYSYTVTNTGNVPLTDVALSDNLLGPITLTEISLAVGASVTGTASHVVVSSELSGPIVNTATATGKYGEVIVTGTKSLSVPTKSAPPENPVPAISLEKTADKIEAGLGDKITYSYTVTNTGNVPLTDVALSDNLLGPITLTEISLAVGASVTGTASHVVVSSELSGPIVNTATATGKYGEVTVTDEARLSIPIKSTPPTEYKPAINVVKTASRASAYNGETIIYNYTVRNTGNVPLKNITLNDDKLGVITLSGTALAINATVTGTATHVVASNEFPGPLTNTAITKGFYGEGTSDFVTNTTSVSVALLTSGGGGDDDDDDPAPPALPEEKPGKMEITKVIEGGGPLAGISFKLFKGQELVKTGVTNDKGILLFNGLEPSKEYSLEEIVPQGFKTNLNKNAKITVLTDATTNVLVVNTPPAPPALEEEKPEPPTPSAPEKELPVTGGNNIAYLMAGLLSLGLGLVARKHN